MTMSLRAVGEAIPSALGDCFATNTRSDIQTAMPSKRKRVLKEKEIKLSSEYPAQCPASSAREGPGYVVEYVRKGLYFDV